FGPWGAGGCALGCIAGSLLLGGPDIYTLYECLADLIIGLGMWCLWHLENKTGAVFLKKPVDYVRYMLMLLVLSGTAGLAAYVMLPDHAFLPYFGAYFIQGIIVGIPILILMTSIVCVEPVLPPWRKRAEGLTGVVSLDPESLISFNERLEEYALTRKVKMKEIFSVQNCIEEVLIRFQDANPDSETRIRVEFHDSVSIDFENDGNRCNPFRSGKEEETETLMGLKLILHRALRSSYSHSDGCNIVHIVM
ncbi:MAG: hypothetical protein J5966_06565, partial [Lachnospiraceae bacterium]|nr:hypothetical protein [Lachnospiraceae bacterium]